MTGCLNLHHHQSSYVVMFSIVYRGGDINLLTSQMEDMFPGFPKCGALMVSGSVIIDGKWVRIFTLVLRINITPRARGGSFDVLGCAMASQQGHPPTERGTSPTDPAVCFVLEESHSLHPFM